MSKRRLIEQAASHITKKFTDQGKLIEAGWAAYAHFVLPKDAPAVQIRETHLAFMAGADHLFSSIMNILDPGEEPTEADMNRMELISRELDEWRVRISNIIDPPQGRA